MLAVASGISPGDALNLITRALEGQTGAPYFRLLTEHGKAKLLRLIAENWDVIWEYTEKEVEFYGTE